jgi:single-strand DNA-binding protein
VRVTCWRRLAEGVTHSVLTGDPLVVTGRMYTRDWVGDDGQHRVSYELEAIAVGHDLSRGFARFTRHRAAGATSMVEDAEADARVGGGTSVPIGPPASPGSLGSPGFLGSPGPLGSPGMPAVPPRRHDDVDDLPMPDAPAPTFEPPPMNDSYGEFGSAEAENSTGTRAASAVEVNGGSDGETPTGDGHSDDAHSDDERAAEEDAMNVLREAGLGGGPAGTGRPSGKRGRPRVPVPA